MRRLLLLLVLAAAGCAPPPDWDVPEEPVIPELPPDPGTSPGEIPLTWYFVPEEPPVADHQYWRFHTKDPELAADGGRTLWKITGRHPSDGSATRYGLIRWSGQDRGGYGVVLHFEESPAPSFYLILIDCLGHRFAGRYQNGTLTVLAPWQSHPDLLPGRGVENRLSVTERGPGAFDIRFNEGPPWELRDPDPLLTTGEGTGLCAVVTPREILPPQPVDIRYWTMEE
jgi:hypothetical protein